MKENYKILWVSDGVHPTGFSRVAHGIIGNLPKDWEITHYAINYKGSPHNYKHLIYPTAVFGDREPYGFERFPIFAGNEFDAIFILNDIWIVNIYLDLIKKHWKNPPPVVVYLPVDASGYEPEWFTHSDVVSQYVVYTEFGKQVCSKAAPEIDFKIIPHGSDNKMFYEMDHKEAKKTIFPEDLHDSFVVLNANRNQPRKRIDLALKGFSLFAENKPKNVVYYHHAGLVDSGWDVRILARRYGLQDRLITTDENEGLQTVSEEALNIIYNASDVGINSSMGEGWGLTATEHAITGAPQIVPDSSACRELFEDVGLLIPTTYDHTYEKTMTVARVVTPEDIAEQLEILYVDDGLYELLSKLGKEKFLSKEYTWKSVAKKFETVFREVINGNN